MVSFGMREMLAITAMVIDPLVTLGACLALIERRLSRGSR